MGKAVKSHSKQSAIRRRKNPSPTIPPITDLVLLESLILRMQPGLGFSVSWQVVRDRWVSNRLVVYECSWTSHSDYPSPGPRSWRRAPPEVLLDLEQRGLTPGGIVGGGGWTGDRYFLLFVHRAEVAKLLPNNAQEMSQSTAVLSNKRGPKERFEWDLLMAEVLRRVHEAGVPRNLTEFSDALVEWCGAKLDGAPEADTIYRRLRIWLSKVPRQN
jgi:hypothetical protein